MSTPVERIWITPELKEQTVQRFIQEQSRASSQISEATAQAASQAREASETLNRILFENETQTALFQETAERQRRDAVAARLMPEALFQALGGLTLISGIIDILTSPRLEEIADDKLLQVHKSISTFVQFVATIDSQYLSDFSQKAQLADLRQKLGQKLAQLNAAPIPNKQRLVIAIMRKQLTPLMVTTGTEVDRLFAIKRDADKKRYAVANCTEGRMTVFIVLASLATVLLVALSLLILVISGYSDGSIVFALVTGLLLVIGIWVLHDRLVSNPMERAEAAALAAKVSYEDTFAAIFGRVCDEEQLGALLEKADWDNTGWCISPSYAETMFASQDMLWNISA